MAPVYILIVLVLIWLLWRRSEGYMPYKPDTIPPPRMFWPDPGFYPAVDYFAPISP